MVLPSLPTELVEHIIKLSLPTVRYDTFTERYRLLRSYSLVNSVWKELAQAELLKHVSVEPLKAAAIRQALSNARARVSSVYAQELSDDELTELALLLRDLSRSPSRLAFLRLSNTALEPGLSMILDECPGILTLFLANIDWRVPSHVQSFVNLTCMTIANSYVEADAARHSILNPTTLPALRKLQLIRSDQASFVEENSNRRPPSGFLFAVLSLAPQLQILDICEDDEPSLVNAILPAEWQTFTSLRRLSVNKGANGTVPSYSNLASLIPQLDTLVAMSIGGLEQTWIALEQAARAWSATKCQVKVVKYRKVTGRLEADVHEDGDGQARASFIALTQALGATVVELESDTMYETSETFFDWCVHLTLLGSFFADLRASQIPSFTSSTSPTLP